MKSQGSGGSFNGRARPQQRCPPGASRAWRPFLALLGAGILLLTCNHQLCPMSAQVTEELPTPYLFGVAPAQPLACTPTPCISNWAGSNHTRR